MPNFTLKASVDAPSGNVAFPESTYQLEGALPFSVTTADIGNLLREPGSKSHRGINYRREHSVSAVSTDRIFANQLHHFDSYVDGFLDGADVSFYRMSGSTITEVRRDTVATSVIRPLLRPLNLPDNTIVPAGTTTFTATTNGAVTRGGVTYYAVVSVDAAGNRSAPSNWVQFTAPQTIVAGSPANTTASKTLTGVEDGAITAPANLTMTLADTDSSAVLTWDAVAGVEGYQVLRYDYDYATQPPGEYLDLTNGAALAAVAVGDLMVVRKQLDPSVDPRTWRIGGTGLDHHPFLRDGGGPLNIGATNAYFTEDATTKEAIVGVTLGAGDRQTFKRVVHGNSVSETYYDVLEDATDYLIEFQARRVSGTGSATLKIDNTTLDPAETLSLTTSMQTFTRTFQKVSEPPTLGTLKITFENEGVFEFTEPVISRAKVGDIPLEMSTEQLAKLQDFSPSYLRDHNWIKTRPDSYSLEGYTDSTLLALPSLLRNCELAGADPWLQVEWVFKEEEWLGLVEYLAAPYVDGTDTPASKPWAYKRFQQGRTAPWIDAFTTVGLEIGNENWNTGLVGFYAFPEVSGQTNRGTINGAFIEYVIAILKTSPYWAALEPKFKSMAGGRNESHGNFSEAVALASPSSDYITHNLYNGSNWEDNLSGDGLLTWSPEYAHAVLAGATAFYKSRFETWNTKIDALNVGRAKPIYLAGYEQQHTTPTLPNSSTPQAEKDEQERVWKSKAVQTGIVDQFMTFAANGAVLQNWFTFSAGPYWSSHNRDNFGGQTYAAFQWLGLINRELMEKVRGTRVFKAQRADVTYTNGENAIAADQLAVFYLEKGNKRGVVVVNRRVPGLGYDSPAGNGIATVSIGLPDAVTSVDKWVMSGAWDDHNSTLANKDVFQLSSSAVTSAEPTKRVETTIGPADVQVFIYTV